MTLRAIITKAAAAALCLICGIATPANANGNGIIGHTADALAQAQRQQYCRQPKLKDVESLIKGKDAEIGVAWMEGNAMHSVNNERLYPLMSVSKLHVAIALLFVVFILLFKAINSTSVIDAIYILCSYTYGPLLGLFAFGLLTKRQVTDKAAPYIAVASPLICLAANYIVPAATGYKFGYELLLLNGMITFAGLWLSGLRKSTASN